MSEPFAAHAGPVTVLLAPDGTVTACGDGAARLFGCPAPAAVGARLPDLLGPACAEPLAGALKQAAAGRPWRGTLPLAGGTMEVSCDPMAAGSGRTLVALTVAPPWAGGLELLNEAGRRIGSTLDLHRTAAEIVGVTVPRFADAGAIYVLEALLADGRPAPPAGGAAVVRRLAIAFAEDDPGSWARDFPVNEVIVYPPDTPYARCVNTARMVEFGSDAIPDAIVHRAGPAVDGLLDHVSLLAVPLVARGRVLGFAVFSRKRGRLPFAPADTALAAELASRAATCVDNACLYRRERRTVAALQAGLKPGRVAAPAGLEIAHRYVPAGGDVGGDWYDVVALPDDRVAIVIGDSVGHGVTAAAAMGQLRIAAHTLAGSELPPAEVLTRLDTIAQGLDAAQFATCLCLVCDPATMRCELACAGHPPPLLALAGGTARHFAVPHGLPLGVSDPAHPPEYEQVSAVIPAGATLAFYTDGLVESRLRNVDEGIARLASALVASQSTSLDATADGVLTLLADQQGHDDIALLLVRATGPGTGPGTGEPGGGTG